MSCDWRGPLPAAAPVGLPDEHQQLVEDRLRLGQEIARRLEAMCSCYALTHPNHAHDCAMTTWAAANVVRAIVREDPCTGCWGGQESCRQARAAGADKCCPDCSHRA